MTRTIERTTGYAKICARVGARGCRQFCICVMRALRSPLAGMISTLRLQGYLLERAKAARKAVYSVSAHSRLNVNLLDPQRDTSILRIEPLGGDTLFLSRSCGASTPSHPLPGAVSYHPAAAAGQLPRKIYFSSCARFLAPRVDVPQHSQSEDIWENGTVVHYLAGAIAALLAMAMLYAAKEQLLGNETFEGRRIKRTPAAKKDR